MKEKVRLLLEKIKLYRTKVGIGVLGVLVLTGAVFGAYKFGQKQAQLGSTPSPTPMAVVTPTPEALPTPTLEPTADWETYTNSKYGYLLKHPRGWIFKAEVVSDETKPLYVIRENVLSNIVDDYLVFISVWDNPNRRSLINWLQFMKDSGALPIPAEAELAANYTVAGEPAFKIWSDPISKGKEPGRCFQACPILDVYFTHGDKTYRVELNYHREVDKESQETFNFLLSTFKFLPSPDSTGSPLTSSGQREKVFCKDPRPQVCTMECIQNPPYICGSNGKSYCSECQACADPGVEWYIIQDEPCGAE